MLEVMGKYYYIDVDKVIDKCRPVYNTETTAEKPTTNNSDETTGDPNATGGDDGVQHQLELNVFKFECYKACIERIFNEYKDEDDGGIAAFTNKNDFNAAFAIAFNTLLKNDILIEDNE